MSGFKELFERFKQWLSRLSFRTGLIVFGAGIAFQLASFVPMLSDISAQLKGVIWFWMFGAGKAAQYSGLTIMGVEGIKGLRNYFKKRKENKDA